MNATKASIEDFTSIKSNYLIKFMEVDLALFALYKKISENLLSFTRGNDMNFHVSLYLPGPTCMTIVFIATENFLAWLMQYQMQATHHLAIFLPQQTPIPIIPSTPSRQQTSFPTLTQPHSTYSFKCCLVSVYTSRTVSVSTR